MIKPASGICISSRMNSLLPVCAAAILTIQKAEPATTGAAKAAATMKARSRARFSAASACPSEKHFTCFINYAPNNGRPVPLNWQPCSGYTRARCSVSKSGLPRSGSRSFRPKRLFAPCGNGSSPGKDSKMGNDCSVLQTGKNTRPDNPFTMRLKGLAFLETRPVVKRFSYEKERKIFRKNPAISLTPQAPIKPYPYGNTQQQ